MLAADAVASPPAEPKRGRGRPRGQQAQQRLEAARVAAIPDALALDEYLARTRVYEPPLGQRILRNAPRPIVVYRDSFE